MVCSRDVLAGTQQVLYRFVRTCCRGCGPRARTVAICSRQLDDRSSFVVRLELFAQTGDSGGGAHETTITLTPASPSRPSMPATPLPLSAPVQAHTRRPPASRTSPSPFPPVQGEVSPSLSLSPRASSSLPSPPEQARELSSTSPSILPEVTDGAQQISSPRTSTGGTLTTTDMTVFTRASSRRLKFVGVRARARIFSSNDRSPPSSSHLRGLKTLTSTPATLVTCFFALLHVIAQFTSKPLKLVMQSSLAFASPRFSG